MPGAQSCSLRIAESDTLQKLCITSAFVVETPTHRCTPSHSTLQTVGRLDLSATLTCHAALLTVVNSESGFDNKRKEFLQQHA